MSGSGGRNSRRVARIDRPERRHPQERPARVDPLQLIGRAERLGDADRVDLVTRFARPKHEGRARPPPIRASCIATHNPILPGSHWAKLSASVSTAAPDDLGLVGRIRLAVDAERTVERISRDRPPAPRRARRRRPRCQSVVSWLEGPYATCRCCGRAERDVGRCAPPAPRRCGRPAPDTWRRFACR